MTPPYTKKLPTQNGWYWVRRDADDDPDIVFVNDERVAEVGFEIAYPLAHWSGFEWSGPLEPPAAPVPEKE